jgi:phage baseplate assembly protein W
MRSFGNRSASGGGANQGVGDMSRIDFPFQFDGRGRTGQSSEDEYIRELIEQVLLTAPGERVMRPDFGSGVRQLLFGAASPEIATAAQYLVQGSLQQWLADLITVEAVEVEARGSALLVNVQYVVRRSQTRAVAEVRVEGGS